MNKLRIFTLFPKRKFDRTIAMIDICARDGLEQKEIEAKIVEESMLPVLPVVSMFPFMGIHPPFDVYANFRFEAKHCISEGIGRLLKERVVLTLGGDNRATS